MGLVEEEGRTHKVHVPEGMMDDIVRPLWDYRVIVTGLRRGRVLRLVNITKVEDADSGPPE